MKRIIIVCLIFLAFSQLKAEDEYYYHKIKYEAFVEWMQSVKLPGLVLSQTQIQGSEETYNLEYSAAFTNDKYEDIRIRIGHPDIFYGYEDLINTHTIVGPYDLDGFVAVFVYREVITKPSNITYMLVQMPENQATFSITALTKERLTKEKMEEYFKNFKLKTVENKNLKWPDVIPIAFRLPGVLNEIEVDKTKEEFATNVIELKILKSEEFMKELRRFYKEKRGWLELTTYKNITLICKTSQDMNVLENMKDGEPIEFVYYVK